MAHTPGPWAVDEIRSVQAITWCGEVCIADVGGNADEEEQLANARLIAAAPDLLAACEAMIAAEKACDILAGDSAITAIRAAIARAKGE